MNDNPAQFPRLYQKRRYDPFEVLEHDNIIPVPELHKATQTCETAIETHRETRMRGGLVSWSVGDKISKYKNLRDMFQSCWNHAHRPPPFGKQACHADMLEELELELEDDRAQK